MLRAILNDLRHSVRMLREKPGFVAVVILTLALGVGANSAVFSAIQGLLLAPLPYPDSERLVEIYNSYPKTGEIHGGVTVPDYIDRREGAPGLADSAIYHRYGFDLAAEGRPQRVPGVVTSPSLFTTLGVQARLGRTFTDAEAETGRERVVLLSDSLWRDQFAADEGIVGRDIRLGGHPYRVVGVMPAAFAFPRRDVQLWVPFAFSDKQKSDAMRGFDFAESIGRLKPGMTTAQLDAQFDAIVARNLERLAGPGAADAMDFRAHVESTGFTGRSRKLHEALAGEIGPKLWLLQGAVAFVLLIACANVANLMLIRAGARQRELHLRAALGASRARIARQLLTESLVLALAGGIVGVGVAWLGVELIRLLGLDRGTHGFSIGLDAPVWAFSLASVLATGLVCGLVPVLSLWRSRPADVLRQGARGTIGGRSARIARNALVVVQLALAVALFVGAGLLIHSFVRLQQQDPGFESDRVLTASVSLARDRYPDAAAAARLRERLMQVVRALPGVESAGVVSAIPFSDDNDSAPYFIEGHDATAAASARSAYSQLADEGFFATMGIPLLQGRGFQAGDDTGAPAVAIIDQALATQAFGEHSPLGQRIATRVVGGQLSWRTIVGVVASVKRHGLHEDGAPTYYFPVRQLPTRVFRIVIRSDLAPGELLVPLRDAMLQIDPEQPIYDLMSMRERIALSLDERRAPMLLLMLFAAIALGLAGVGVYGVLAFAVAQRTGEIGVRMSLGARGADIVRMVLVDGGRLLTIGLLVGTAVALALARQMRAQLFGVDVVDPLSLGAVLVLVAAVALLASWLPARRAARVSPMEALRYE